MADKASSILAAPDARKVRSESYWGRVRRSYLNSRTGLLASAGLLAVILTAVFASILAPHDAELQALSQRLKPPFWIDGNLEGYVLGTDAFGRDILSRVMFGGQVSLFIAFFSSSVGAVIGITLGLIAGFSGGVVDRIIMRMSDIWIAFPFLMLAIGVIAVVGSDLFVLVALLSVFGWVLYARVTRGQTLRIRTVDYVTAATVIGAGNVHTVVRHILPNILAPNIVIWTFSIATLILIESSLSFLGLGVRPPTPTWGNILSEGRAYVTDAWWLAVFPGLAITFTVLCVNMLGDSIRDILDPRLNS